SISDETMLAYYPLVTNVAPAELSALTADVRAGRLHGMAAKKRLAEMVVAQFHGAGAAQEAARAFERQYQAREVPEHVPEVAPRRKNPLTGSRRLTIISLCLDSPRA